jgi:hypothetical protein
MGFTNANRARKESLYEHEILLNEREWREMGENGIVRRI